MNELKNKKTIIIVILIIILVLILILSSIVSNKMQSDVVDYNVVEELYNDLDKTKCEENCDNREYVSKLFGYAFDNDNNIEMQVKEGYIENNIVYDLEGKEIGTYSKNELNNILDSGSMKVYNYEKVNNEYKLKEEN